MNTRTRTPVALLLLLSLLLTLLSGCARQRMVDQMEKEIEVARAQEIPAPTEPAPTEPAPEATPEATPENEPQPTEAPEPSDEALLESVLACKEKLENPDDLAFVDMRKAKTKEEVIAIAMAILERAEYPYTHMKLRSCFYAYGEKYPGLWLYAVNTLGETLDIIVSERSDILNEMVVGDDSMRLGLQYARKNAAHSFNNRLHTPKDYLSSSTSDFSKTDNTLLGIWISGTTFPFFDLGYYLKLPKESGWDYSDENWGISYWNGEEMVEGWHRPDPSYPEADPAWYEYVPAESLDAEIAVMQEKLAAADKGYRWEIQDSIEIDGKTYPVKWLSVLNNEGEWMDAIFSEDPDLCYLLHNHKDELADKRTVLPGERNVSTTPRNEFRNQWLVEDVFYSGYGYYEFGTTTAIQDAGSAMRDGREGLPKDRW